MSREVFSLDVYVMESNWEARSHTRHELYTLRLLPAVLGAEPFTINVNEAGFVAARDSMERNERLTLTIATAPACPPRFDEEKPPTPTESRYTPEPTETEK